MKNQVAFREALDTQFGVLKTLISRYNLSVLNPMAELIGSKNYKNDKDGMKLYLLDLMDVLSPINAYLEQVQTNQADLSLTYRIETKFLEMRKEVL